MAAPAELDINKRFNYTLTLQTASGEPANEVAVDIMGFGIKTGSGELITDTNGQITIPVHTGFKPGKGTLTARVGLYTVATTTVNIIDPAKKAGGQWVDTPDSVIMGDITSDTVYRYTLFNDNTVDIPLNATVSVTANGPATEHYQLQLGDIFDPNLQPLYTLAMNGQTDVIVDDTGLHSVSTEKITQFSSGPFGFGKSFFFAGTQSRLSTPVANTLAPQQSVGFRLNVYPSEKTNGEPNGGQIIKDSHQLRYENQKRAAMIQDSHKLNTSSNDSGQS